MLLLFTLSVVQVCSIYLSFFFETETKNNRRIKRQIEGNEAVLVAKLRQKEPTLLSLPAKLKWRYNKQWVDVSIWCFITLISSPSSSSRPEGRKGKTLTRPSIMRSTMHTCPSWLIRGFPISLVQSLVEEGTHFSIILLPLIQKVAYGHFALYALVLPNFKH